MERWKGGNDTFGTNAYVDTYLVKIHMETIDGADQGNPKSK